MATEVTRDEAIARVVASATQMGVELDEQALDGPTEATMVAQLLSLRNSLQARESHAQRTDEMVGIQEAALGAVNDYFERALRSLPEIEAYLEDIAKREP